MGELDRVASDLREAAAGPPETYAADLGSDPTRVITWPPGRNEPGRCGSGGTYQKCCAAPGAGGLG
jgi:hypothetical protein